MCLDALIFTAFVSWNCYRDQRVVSGCVPRLHSREATFFVVVRTGISWR